MCRWAGVSVGDCVCMCAVKCVATFIDRAIVNFQFNLFSSTIGSDPQTADCGLPPSLHNGQFTLSSGTIEGSRATYSCFRGYQLVGSSYRFCLSTGLWTQEHISCQSES